MQVLKLFKIAMQTTCWWVTQLHQTNKILCIYWKENKFIKSKSKIYHVFTNTLISFVQTFSAYMDIKVFKRQLWIIALGDPTKKINQGVGKWNVTLLIRRGINFYFFAALYWSCLGLNVLLASPRYKGLQQGHYI